MTMTVTRRRPRLLLPTVWPQWTFASLVIALIVAGMGGPLTPVFLVGSVAVGFRLLRLSPPAYIGFVFWLWFLSPLVRRLADVSGSWINSEFVLVTPYLAAILSMLPTLEHALTPGTARRGSTGHAAFGLAAAGAAVGVPFGLLANQYQAGLESLNYFVPLCLGWYVAARPGWVRGVERELALTFGRAALVVGAYGIYQYTRMPVWDALWMIRSEMLTIGQPQPFAVRVFSTMHSPGVLGPFLIVPLVLWLARPRAWGIPAVGAAGVTLLLSQIRSAWIALIVAAALVIAALRPAQQLRAVIAAGVAASVAGALLLTPEMSESFGARVATMRQLDEDTSARARLRGHALALEFVAANPIGIGIGQNDAEIETQISMRDATLVAALIQFGLPGAALYLAALGVLLVELWGYYRRRRTWQGTALASTGIGFLAISVLGVLSAGPVGMCLWVIGGLAVADRRAAAWHDVEEGKAA